MDNNPRNPARVPGASAAGSHYPASGTGPMPMPETATMPLSVPIPPLAAMSERETEMRPNPYGDKAGELPQRGMLANAYVPFQQPGNKYSQNEGLQKGTLFPGLDLPFKHYTATRNVADTPMGELMALDFAMAELGLYLDTHPEDGEALRQRNAYVKMYKEAQKNYERQYGPITQATVMDGRYTWLHAPWPWEVK